MDRLLGSRRVLIIRLVEQEIGGELLVLIAGKVGLNSLVAIETKAAQLLKTGSISCFHIGGKSSCTYTLNSIALLLRHGDRLGTRRQWGILIALLTKQAKELIGMMSNELGKLGIASTELLQDRL